MKKILGKVSDFWTIPLALIIVFCVFWFSVKLELFNPAPEQIMKFFTGVALLLFVLGVSRLIHLIQYPDTYKDGLMKNSNKAWDSLPSEKKFLYSWLQRLFIAFLLAIILSAL